MKRREFFKVSLGASTIVLPLVAQSQVAPCPPTGLGVVGGTAAASGSCGVGASGFAARPYFFQPDVTRLKGLISSSDPSATGSSSNSAGQPLGFITLMRTAFSARSSYSDLPAWNFAVAGWLTADTAMMDLAKNECLTLVRKNPTGSPISSDEYQHIEELMMNTALVVDCCFSRFTPAERNEVANFVNGAMVYAEGQDATFWPYGDPHNNYWNNRHLAVCIAGLCGEGWNTQAATWRTKFESLSSTMVQKYTAPFYSGPQATEGHYYSAYIRNSLWALRQYDNVTGSNYLGRLSFTPRDALNLALYQLRPHNGSFFSIGSEAADSTAPFHSTTWCLWYQLIHMSGAAVEAGVAKTLLASTAVTADGRNFWSRTSKGFVNFYWSLSNTPSLAVTAKTDRSLVLPTPGGAMTHFRSARGWNNAVAGRAAVMFHSRTAWSGGDSPGYSHANVDQPGFQWAQDDQWLAMDPEVFGTSGIAAEAGSAIASDFSNIVTLGSAKSVSGGQYPVVLFNESNLSASVPHYYVSINAQPYWNMCSTYRREYVWMDDLQVVLVFDRVVTSGVDTKTWRLNVDGAPNIASGIATISTPKGVRLEVRDLYSTAGTGLTVVDLNGVGSVSKSVYQLRQIDASNDYTSIKLLSANSRVSAASVQQPNSNEYQVTLTVAGNSYVVRFFANGTHAVVS